MVNCSNINIITKMLYYNIHTVLGFLLDFETIWVFDVEVPKLNLTTLGTTKILLQNNKNILLDSYLILCT